MKSHANAGNPMYNCVDEVIHVIRFLNAMGFKGEMFGKKKVLLPSSILRYGCLIWSLLASCLYSVAFGMVVVVEFVFQLAFLATIIYFCRSCRNLISLGPFALLSNFAEVLLGETCAQASIFR